jgi:chromosome segregation ATPase
MRLSAGARKLKETEHTLEVTSRERNDLLGSVRKPFGSVTKRCVGARKAHGWPRRMEVTSLKRRNRSFPSAKPAMPRRHKALELNNKVQELQDDVAELTYARDAATKSAKKAEEEAAGLRQQAEQTNADREASARQVTQLTAELDEQRKKVLDLAEQKSQVAQSDSAHAIALAEARQQVLNLTQERDNAHNRANDHARELEELRQQLQVLRDEIGQQSLDISEREELKRQIAEMTPTAINIWNAKKAFSLRPSLSKSDSRS